MKELTYVPDPLNEQASVLVDAQTDIKTAIKQGVLSGLSSDSVKESVKKVINAALARIRSPTLKEDARISLMRFSAKAYSQFSLSISTIPPQFLPAVVILVRAVTASGKTDGVYMPQGDMERGAAEAIGTSVGISYNAYAKGIPLQEFQKKYINRVTEALDKLAQENALDPNDFTGRNSLRNLAEMQVRYERHQDEIADLKAKGTKLVVCSVHADCSDRCAKWQGGVYSLDGTEGYTEDGRKFQPLENATDVFYTTKAGRTYKNGLLGFNCRHKLFEYRPRMEIPTVSKEEQRREYEITKLQRQFERSVVEARENALSQKGVNAKQHARWKAEAERRFNIYKAFCKEHGRAYYPDRVKIL